MQAGAPSFAFFWRRGYSPNPNLYLPAVILGVSYPADKSKALWSPFAIFTCDKKSGAPSWLR
jgi:hypothetical protein